MTKKMKLALIAVVAAGIASPAFAQTYRTGPGYAAAHSGYAAAGARATRNNTALGAYGYSPNPAPNPTINAKSGTSTDPEATGGGSVGYNSHVYD